MNTYEAVVKLLNESREAHALIKQVRELPNNYILLDCNFARSARLHVVDNNVYIEADEQLKSQLSQLFKKLLNRRD